MIRTVLLSLSMAGFASSALSASWVSACVADDNDGQWYVDADNLKIERGQPLVQLKHNLPSASGDAREERILIRLDCVAWKMSALRWSRHNRNGSLLSSGRLPDTFDNYRELRPDSAFDVVATRLCSQLPIAAGRTGGSGISNNSDGSARAANGRMTIDGAIRHLGGRITSGRRTPEMQQALYEGGFTRVRNSAHVYDRARDIVGLTRQEIFAAAQLAQVEVRSLVWESGRGRHQGTGAHWHLEFANATMTNSHQQRGQLRWRTCERARPAAH